MRLPWWLGIVLLIWAAGPCEWSMAEEPDLGDESLAESEEEDFDPQEVLERLAQLRQRPLDPNRASFSQLEQIPYLSAAQIRDILNVRKKRRFSRLEELLQAESMDPGTLARVRPFLRIRPEQGVGGHLRSRVSLAMPRSRGYRQGIFLGDPWRAYLRLSLCAGEHLWLGALCEKDPGEMDLADYRSGFVQLENLGPLARAVLGDFALEFGQGLVLWTGSGSANGLQSPSDAKRCGRGIRPYTGADENRGLPGVAISVAWGPLGVDLFCSRAHLDARLERGLVSSLDLSGLHRTPAEMDRQDALREDLAGGHAGLEITPEKRMGVLWYGCRYRPGLAGGDPVRQRYAFRGQRSQFWGSYLDLGFGPLGLFGEIAVSAVKAPGALLGLLLDGDRLRATLVWRGYAADFSNPHCAALAAKECQNENGLLLGLTWRAARGARVELLVDGYRRPWRTYSLEMPSAGESWSIQLWQRLADGLSLTVRHRERFGQESGDATAGWRKNIHQHLRTRRFQLDWQASSELELRGRMELSRFSKGSSPSVERGALLLVQMSLRPIREMGLKGSMAVFRVPSYDGRLYVCEMGPTGVAGNVALWGRGRRVFLMLDASLARGLKLSARYGQTLFDDRRALGTGLDQVEAPAKSEALIQLDWRW